MKAITCHLEVVDQYGGPVSGATVKLSPVDRPFGDQSGSKITLVSDVEGEFYLKGKQGFAMGVSASKDGYMTLPPLNGPSSSAMIYSGREGKTGKRYNNPATPLVLTRHGIGPVEPISYVKDKVWKLLIDGTVRVIARGPEANHSGFGEVHSAQWRWPYQSTHLFWNRLIRELQLTRP